MNGAISVEVVDLETQILEDSPMTESEVEELSRIKGQIKTAYAEKLERDLAIGNCLLHIFRHKLYRGRDGGRTWRQWLTEESAELTGGSGPIGEDTAERLRGFYRFRVEILESAPGRIAGIPLPTHPKQVRPLLGQLDNSPEDAIEIWKAGCAQANGAPPSYTQVSRAAAEHRAQRANDARLFASQGSHPQVAANAPSPGPSPAPAEQWGAVPRPFAWEMEKDDSALNAGAECRELSQMLSSMRKVVGNIRAFLYGRINTHGSDYIDALRSIDAGVYSVGDIDRDVQLTVEDLDFITRLLSEKTGPGELSRSTLDVDSFPTRN